MPHTDLERLRRLLARRANLLGHGSLHSGVVCTRLSRSQNGDVVLIIRQNEQWQ